MQNLTSQSFNIVNFIVALYRSPVHLFDQIFVNKVKFFFDTSRDL